MIRTAPVAFSISPTPLAMLLFALMGVRAPVISAGAFSPPASPKPAAAPPPIQELGQGIFQIGAVRLDKTQKTISFPATVNMSTGVVEYAVVGSHGKLHESVLATKAEPYHIHLAMLLLGATNRNATVESGAPLTGHPITVSVSWTNVEKVAQMRLENLICKEQQAKMMEPGIWIYNGSRVVDGTFLAQRDESIISIIEDLDALMNNPRKGRENDQIWFVNEKVVPPPQTPVWITFQIRPSQNEPKS